MDSSKKNGEKLSPEQAEFWDRMARLDPASPALLIPARIWLNQGRPDKALEFSRAAAETRPESIEALALAARALVEMNRLDEARTLANRAASLLDGLGETLADLAAVFSSAGDSFYSGRAEEAARALGAEVSIQAREMVFSFDEGRVVAEGPDMIVTETLAELYFKQGHRDQAEEIYKRLLQQDPRNRRILDRLAEITGATGYGLEEAGLTAEDFSTRPETQAAADLDRREGRPQTREAKKRLKRKLERIRDAARRRREALEAGPSEV